MFNYLLKQFTEFRENQKIIKTGLMLLMDDIQKKIIEKSVLNITFTRDNFIYSFSWDVSTNPLKFKPLDNKIKNRNIEDFIVSLLRDGNILTIIFSNDTGQNYKGKNICELWGYRMVILDNVCSLQYISGEDLYRYNTTDLSGEKIPPDESTIYCGPEGKIFGWEKI